MSSKGVGEDFGESYMKTEGNEKGHSGHPVMFGGLIIGLAFSLAGNVYLWDRSDQFGNRLKTVQNTTEKQIARLSEATTTILEQRLQAQNEQFEAAVKGAEDTAKAAVSKARLEAQQQSKALTAKLEEQRKQLADQLVQLRDVTQAADSAADSKISDVSAKVGNVWTDVTTP